MNEEIRELARQAKIGTAEFGNGLNYFVCTEETFNHFAELIVRECVEEIEFQYGGGNLMEDDTHNPEWDRAIECVSAFVRHRFGIKK